MSRGAAMAGSGGSAAGGPCAEAPPPIAAANTEPNSNAFMIVSRTFARTDRSNATLRKGRRPSIPQAGGKPPSPFLPLESDIEGAGPAVAAVGLRDAGNERAQGR